MDEILKKFVKWTKIKFKIHIAEKARIYFKEREIWWCSLGANIGHEEDGKNKKFERPVLVLKKFNQHILWALPITTKQKEGRYYHNIEYEGETYVIILSQLRLISSKRLTRKIRRLQKEEFDKIREKIKELV